jgi:predicted nucleic acid-binding protein
MAKNILLDTGFWFALYEQENPNYNDANTIAKLFENNNIILPCPTIYDAIYSRFAKNRDYLNAFVGFIKKSNVRFINDDESNLKAIRIAFEYSKIGKRPYNLVDIILREIITDDSVKIDYLCTFNSDDFIDVCKKRNIEIVY